MPIASSSSGMSSARCPRKDRTSALAVAALALAGFAAVTFARAGDEDSARAELRRSWEEACARYDERTNWTARQACNLAWFRTHEKGVWQHNVNPHGPAAAGPSS